MNIRFRLLFFRVLFATGIIAFTAPVLALMFGFSAGASAIARPAHPENPFSRYISIFPGQPTSNSQSFGCDRTLMLETSNYSSFYCTIRLTGDPIINSISISGSGGVIQQTSFSVRLRYGDLRAVYGEPARVTQHSEVVRFRWPHIYAYGRKRIGTRASLFTPIRLVLFHRTDSPY